MEDYPIYDKNIMEMLILAVFTLGLTVVVWYGVKFIITIVKMVSREIKRRIYGL
jgi:hypothetical protein